MAFFDNKKKTDEKKAVSSDRRPAFSAASSLQNPKILEVNLIKNEAEVSFDWTKNLTMFGLVLLIGAILVGEVYYALDNWEESENASLQAISTETNKINADIAKLRNDSADALSFQDKSLVFGELLNNHVYWSPLLSWIEQKTLSSVSYGGFDGNLSGSYNLSASAPTFSDVSWQAGVFLKSPEVKDVKVRRANSTVVEQPDEATAPASTTPAGVVAEAPAFVPEKVTFDLEISLKPEIFKK